MRKVFFGDCENCLKYYLVKRYRKHPWGGVRCPHCGSLSANYNPDVKSVKEFIQELKKYPLDSKVFFSPEGQISEMHDQCIIDEFDDTIIIRPYPHGRVFNEMEVRGEVEEQHRKEQERKEK